MKVGDLVKVTRFGLTQLEYASRLPGLVVSVPNKMRLGSPPVIYVSWPDKSKPAPINVRWLEKINSKKL
ncbi:MAG: hypothetical protein CBC29_06660 [Methylococcaceae bacterium TMED69]|nr:MAG: hypothetical protein CBC29_06660 [Methylococcaceae bacterium TMED69]|tara:strand:+ start:256 stop:462 length:207 start_codon:yes stop_codon:yes gene_type:complete